MREDYEKMCNLFGFILLQAEFRLWSVYVFIVSSFQNTMKWYVRLGALKKRSYFHLGLIRSWFMFPHAPENGWKLQESSDSGLRYGIRRPVCIPTTDSAMCAGSSIPSYGVSHGRWLVVACPSLADSSRRTPTHQRTVVSSKFGRLTHAFGPLATQHHWSTTSDLQVPQRGMFGRIRSLPVADLHHLSIQFWERTSVNKI